MDGRDRRRVRRRGARGGEGADRGGADAGRPDRDHGADDVRVDAPGLRRLGGGPGHRPRLPDLLRLPDPLDPPGLGRGRAAPSRRRAQAAALGPERDRIPDLRHMWVFEKGHVDRLAELGRDVSDQEVAVRRGVLGPDTLATLIYTSGTTGRPKGCALTHGNFFAEVDNAIELLYPDLQARRPTRTRPPPSSSCPSPTSSAAWWRSPVCARGSGWATRRASRRRTSSPTWPVLPPDLPAGHPVRPGEGLQHGPRHRRTHGPRRPPSTGRLAVARRYGEAAGGRSSTAPAPARAALLRRPAPSTTPWSTAASATPWAAGSGTPSAAAPRSAAAWPPSTRARASRSSRATA